MAEVGNTYLQLADLYKTQNPDGTIPTIIEILAQNNEVLMDATAVECNNGTNHITTIRTGLPAGTWRRLYQGVQPEKSTKQQVTDTTGMLETYSEIDAKLVKLAKNPGAFRLSEAKAFLMGLRNTVASTLFYGNTESDPEKFMGLAPRFDSLSAQNGAQIVDGAGTSGNTSIWFLTWGEHACHMLYPQGTMAGLQRQDLGESTKENSDGSLYQVIREHFEWNVGFTVRDWRAVSRYANIDVANLTYNAATGEKLISGMIEAYYNLDHAMVAEGKVAIYCNRTIAEYLHKQAMFGTNVQLRITDVGGKPVTTFLGHPIRRCDAILNTEGHVQ